MKAMATWMVMVLLPAAALAAPREAEQVLFLIDDSSSMTAQAFDPSAPRATRWEVVQRELPGWLGRLGPGTLVGAVSVGGRCGARPRIKLPVGTARDRVTEAVQRARPDGETNLNRVLLSTPRLFQRGVQGGRRIVLLSDGLNSCCPRTSTCDIARDLHRDHGITIDVVSFVTDPSVQAEFECVARVTGGRCTVPREPGDWKTIPLPDFNPWPWIVLALGLATLVLAGRIGYAHGHWIARWTPRRAALVASLGALFGGLLIALVCAV